MNEVIIWITKINSKHCLTTSYNNNWIHVIVPFKYLNLNLLWIIKMKMKIIMGIIVIK